MKCFYCLEAGRTLYTTTMADDDDKVDYAFLSVQVYTGKPHIAVDTNERILSAAAKPHHIILRSSAKEGYWVKR